MRQCTHRTILTICLVAISALLATPKCADGAPIYSQVFPEEPSAAFGSNNSPISQKIADNFSLIGSNPITVRSLRFVGSSGLVIPLSDNFRVVFLKDMGEEPGTPLSGGDFNIGSAFSRKPTGGQLLNGVTIPREYIINLPSGITLRPNTPYWLSITNSLLPDDGWAWARAGGVFDQSLATTFGNIESDPWNTFVSGGMWFELDDQIIPEPPSIMIFLTASITTLLYRHKRGQSGWFPTDNIDR